MDAIGDSAIEKVFPAEDRTLKQMPGLAKAPDERQLKRKSSIDFHINNFTALSVGDILSVLSPPSGLVKLII